MTENPIRAHIHERAYTNAHPIRQPEGERAGENEGDFFHINSFLQLFAIKKSFDLDYIK